MGNQMLGLGERIADAFGEFARALRWMLCDHRVEMRGRHEDETLYYHCSKCGQSWPYYF